MKSVHGPFTLAGELTAPTSIHLTPTPTPTPSPLRRERKMEKEQTRIRIQLTDDQKKQIKEASGEEITAIEFTAQELEDRIAPAVTWKFF